MYLTKDLKLIRTGFIKFIMKYDFGMGLWQIGYDMSEKKRIFKNLGNGELTATWIDEQIKELKREYNFLGISLQRSSNH